MNWNRWPLRLPVLVILALGLMACSGRSAVGVRLDDLPENLAEDCPHPSEVIDTVQGYTVAHDELRIGRLGDELLECRLEKRAVVQGYNMTKSVFEDPMWRADPKRTARIRFE